MKNGKGQNPPIRKGTTGTVKQKWTGKGRGESSPYKNPGIGSKTRSELKSNQKKSGPAPAVLASNIQEKQLRETRSRKAARDPKIMADLKALKTQWKSLGLEDKQKRIAAIHRDLSYREMAGIIGKSPTTIRQVMESTRKQVDGQNAPTPNRPEPEKPEAASNPQRAESADSGEFLAKPVLDQESRAIEILMDFISGRHGAPLLSCEDFTTAGLRVDLYFSNPYYGPPKKFDIQPDASSAEVISCTRPANGNLAEWLASIRASLSLDPFRWNKALGLVLQTTREEREQAARVEAQARRTEVTPEPQNRGAVGLLASQRMDRCGEPRRTDLERQLRGFETR